MQQQQAQQQDQRAPFMLNPTMLDTIMGGLASLPYNVAAPVIEDLRAQYAELEQRAKAEQAAAEQAAEKEAEPEVEAGEAE